MDRTVELYIENENCYVQLILKKENEDDQAKQYTFVTDKPDVLKVVKACRSENLDRRGAFLYCPTNTYNFNPCSDPIKDSFKDFMNNLDQPIPEPTTTNLRALTTI